MQDSLLQKTIKCLSLNNRFHIAVHDVSGAIHSTPSLKLAAENTIHSSPFCNAAKITPEGLRLCLRCKYFSIKKALRTKTMYAGQCHLGMCEVVNPVFFNGHLACIIYIGNFILRDKKHTIFERINKKQFLGRYNRQLLLEAACALHEADADELKEYRKIAGVLSDIITLALGSTEIKHKYKSSISPIFNNSKSWIVESIVNNIHAYYNRNLKLSQFASMYFINPQYLCRLFKKETGMNFSAYLNRVRINNAKSMLKLTNDSITSIAMQTGFNNVTYFNRVFKKFEGTSPGEFRAKA